MFLLVSFLAFPFFVTVLCVRVNEEKAVHVAPFEEHDEDEGASEES